MGKASSLLIPVRHYSHNTRDTSYHCEERNDEAISAVRDCFGLDAPAMTTVDNVIFLMAIGMT